MEHRDDGEPDPGGRFGNRLAAAQERPCGAVTARQDVARHVAMRTQRPLGRAGGPARIEDRGIIVGRDHHVGQRHVRKARPIVRGADDVLEPGGDPIERLGGARDQHALERGEVRVAARQPPMPLVVEDQDLRTRIGQPVFELGAGPPGVQGNHDRADHRRREEAHRPFGQVAHRQRDPVAGPDPEPDQLVRKRRHGAVMRVIGDPFVLVDREQPLTVRPRQVHERAQAGRRVLPYAGGHATDRERLHLELGTGRGEQGLRLAQRHRGPGFGKRDEGFAGHVFHSTKLKVGFGCMPLSTKVSVDSRAAQGNRTSEVRNRGMAWPSRSQSLPHMASTPTGSRGSMRFSRRDTSIRASCPTPSCWSRETARSCICPARARRGKAACRSTRDRCSGSCR